MIKVNGTVIEQNHFPDNSLLVKFTADVKTKNYIEWNYENDGELFTLICLRRSIKSDYVDLYMPYVPHARQDRVKNDEDVFTLKYFCEIINSLNFNHVFVLDVHSNVSLALLNSYVLLSPAPYIAQAIDDINSETLIAFYPDEGAMKRYSTTNEMPYAFGVKNRDWKTGTITGLTLINKERVYGRDVLIIDDICSYGGTFLHSAKALKAAGAANIYLYITHLEDSVLKGDLYKEMKENCLIKQIYTANPLSNDLRGKKMIKVV